MLRRDSEVPRRLPNFPRPPENTFAIPLPHADGRHSNRNEDGISAQYYLGEQLSRQHTFGTPHVNDISSRPLPPLPHSRAASGHHASRESAFGHSARALSGSVPYPSSS